MENEDSDPTIQEENDTDWRSHPGTKSALRALAAQRNIAFKQLESACESSSDPDVRGCLVKWKTIKAVCEGLEGKKS